MYVASDGPRLYYVDANRHINEMGYHGASVGWLNFDLTATTGAPSVWKPESPSGTVQIQASPNPVIVATAGATATFSITYSAPGIPDAEVFMNNTLLCANGSSGSCQANNVSNGTVFSVREKTNGLVLAATTVTVSTASASLVSLSDTAFLSDSGTASPTIAYAAAGSSNVALYVNGALLCQGGPSGTCQASNIGDGTVFTMKDANTGAQLGSLTFNALPANSAFCTVQ